VDQQRPARRMNDMGPRRMDGFPRPQPLPNPAQPRPVRPRTKENVRQENVRQQPVRPQPAPLRREPQRQPQQQPVSRPVGQRRAQQPQDSRQRPVAAQSSAPTKVRKPNRSWRIALQFVIGLAVIAGVAFAIVWLYVRYYQ
jgi:hypothetical protein